MDIKFIRENQDKVKSAIKNKQLNVNVDQLLALDDRRRRLIAETENLRSRRNELARGLKGNASAEAVQKSKKLKEQLSKLELELTEVAEQWMKIMQQIPNIPLDSVPVGRNEQENQMVEEWGKPVAFKFQPKDHIMLGQELDIIDIQRGAKVAGSRFYYLKGAGAILEFAINRFVLSVLTSEKVLKKIANSVERGYNAKPFVPVLPPVFIKPDVYRKTGRLSEEDKNERYYLSQDDQYLTGSAEHSLVAMHMDEILSEKDLPLRYLGFSTNFRREAGSYGQDVKGILRVHQFDKSEMESFTAPEDSLKEHKFLVAIQEYLMRELELPYQKIQKCTADIGVPNANGIDLDVWIPSQERFRETHTADYMTDFQARRLNIKFRKKTGETDFVHTNDATALAIPRILIAILENNQQADGSIKVPKVLREFTGFSEIKRHE